MWWPLRSAILGYFLKRYGWPQESRSSLRSCLGPLFEQNLQLSLNLHRLERINLWTRPSVSSILGAVCWCSPSCFRDSEEGLLRVSDADDVSGERWSGERSFGISAIRRWRARSSMETLGLADCGAAHSHSSWPFPLVALSAPSTLTRGRGPREPEPVATGSPPPVRAASSGSRCFPTCALRASVSTPARPMFAVACSIRFRGRGVLARSPSASRLGV